MKSFGLGGVFMRWIEAYLSGRVSRVHVGGEHSGAIPMRSGVPQGSVGGPLLCERLPGCPRTTDAALCG